MSHMLKTRLNEHRRKDITSPAARHFMDFGHKTEEIKYIGVEKM